jgi:hypothetical protein
MPGVGLDLPLVNSVDVLSRFTNVLMTGLMMEEPMVRIGSILVRSVCALEMQVIHACMLLVKSSGDASVVSACQ